MGVRYGQQHRLGDVGRGQTRLAEMNGMKIAPAKASPSRRIASCAISGGSAWRGAESVQPAGEGGHPSLQPVVGMEHRPPLHGAHPHDGDVITVSTAAVRSCPDVGRFPA